MEIANSLEWPKVETDLRDRIATLPQFSDRKEMHLLVRNVGTLVSELSIEELKARRSASHSMRVVNEKLVQINEMIVNIDGWLLMKCLTRD